MTDPSPTLAQARALLADRRPIDEVAIRRDRLARLRRQLAEHDVAAALIFDPINLRYATGSRNMQVWTMHNFVRYGFVATQGPCILFDLMTSRHLAAGLETIDEIRPAWSADYVIVAERAPEIAGKWAAEIAELVRAHGGGNRRLAVDRFDVPTALALQAQGLTLVDGKIMLERARARKSLEEIRASSAPSRPATRRSRKCGTASNRA
jgi:Xaa-Pro aminopeptidase